MTRRPPDQIETDRHLARNLLLSLSGGAILTIVGVAVSQEAGATEAGSQSTGDAAATSSGATAVGNQAGTNTSNTVTVSGNLGTIQVIDQHATVENAGAASANSGGNQAVGNGSANSAGTGGGGGSGDASAANGSDGSGSVASGGASAIGNQSETGIDQTAEGNATGRLGGILVVNQQADVINEGAASADTGGNDATGNASRNEAGTDQGGAYGSAIAANDGRATNDSDGTGRVVTGDASAIGNVSSTDVNQTAGGTAGGALGGIVLFNQQVAVLNAGTAEANTGSNRAGGNTSANAASVSQGAGAGTGPGDEPVQPLLAPTAAPVSIASNNGEAANTSDGTAAVRTGSAAATGNDSTTTVSQTASGEIVGPGGVGVLHQSSEVSNEGEAFANTGYNQAVGNGSQNGAEVGQTAEAGPAIDVSVAGNFGLAQNDSDGSARIRTGDAEAVGNRSTTEVSQTGAITGGSVTLTEQSSEVDNAGLAVANTGHNEAVGNASENGAGVTAYGSTDAGADVVVVGQFDMATNTSDGTAVIHTGDAAAVGSQSETTVDQSAEADAGVTAQSMSSSVTNQGGALANTGGNTAVGNGSQNSATVTGDAAIGGGLLPTLESLVPSSTPAVQDAIASNNGEASNQSGGSATILTGAAEAIGNESTSSVIQDPPSSGDTVVELSSAVVNEGVAVANTGLNSATGNGSINTAVVGQGGIVLVTSGGPATAVAANDGTASNHSDGTASITTGAAHAVGNSATTTVAQTSGGALASQGAVYIVERSSVVNAGLGAANTGLNAAVGNTSSNNAAVEQSAGSGSGGVVSTDATAANQSAGTARIVTGIATATGNSSTTTVVQSVTVTQVGAMPIVIYQLSHIINVGASAANSGGNLAIGNASVNDATIDQQVGQLIALAFQDLVDRAGLGDQAATTAAGGGGATTAATARATNNSTGTAWIVTGSATAVGNSSTTTIMQGWTGTVMGQGVLYIIQQSVVLNIGVALANTGGNVAVGNASQNQAGVTQVAAGWTTPGSVTSVTAVATNQSNGLARITTGVATATGNSATTTVIQMVSILGGDSPAPFVLVQQGFVHNIGLAVANTGGNVAIGNQSTNDAGVDQQVLGSGEGAVLDATATNTSDGTAIIDTGVPPEVTPGDTSGGGPHPRSGPGRGARHDRRSGPGSRGGGGRGGRGLRNSPVHR